MDCIGKSPSGLGYAITSSRKSDVLVILSSQRKQRCMMSPHISTCTCTLDCADCGPAQADPNSTISGHDTISHDTMHIL